MTKVVQVAVAIITKPNGEYLLASRPNGKGWAGWWEFPGGKIEINESVENALSRELQEELGITPTRTQAWIKRQYDYPATHDSEAKTVLLHFYFVLDWIGKPEPLEGQMLAWQHPQQLNVSPVLPANAPIMQALSLPDTYVISNASEMGVEAFILALQQGLDHGLALLQICEPTLREDSLKALSERVLNQCSTYSTKVLLNASPEQAIAIGTHGVHLNSDRLMKVGTKPEISLVAGSCHQADQLEKAKTLNLDFVTLSPTGSMQSQPKANISWGALTKMIANFEMPVYTLGSMSSDLLSTAQSAGARGIAMQHAYWESFKA